MGIRWLGAAGALWALLGSSSLYGAIQVELEGPLSDELRQNVEAFLVLKRRGDQEELPDAAVPRLYGKAEHNIRQALRPFGYYDPRVIGRWRLEAPVAFTARQRGIAMKTGCFVDPPARLCIGGQWSAGKAWAFEADLDHLGLERLKPWLSQAVDYRGQATAHVRAGRRTVAGIGEDGTGRCCLVVRGGATGDRGAGQRGTASVRRRGRVADLGITLEDIALDLQGTAEGLGVKGSARSGEEVATLSGTVSWPGGTPTGRLSQRGIRPSDTTDTIRHLAPRARTG